jgi:hypothetical protein
VRFCALNPVSSAGSSKRGAVDTLKNNRAKTLVMLPVMGEVPTVCFDNHRILTGLGALFSHTVNMRASPVDF